MLVVEDEAPIRRALEINLEARGFSVLLAATGEDALRLAASGHPDVVLLDLGLPGISGLDVIEGLRGWTKVPIIVVSARDAEGEKVRALDAGADDYITKPFGMDELLARLRSALRRSAPDQAEQAVVATEAFSIDLADKRVLVNGDEVHLTPTEWRLLEVLVRHRGRLVSQQQLLREVWGPVTATKPISSASMWVTCVENWNRSPPSLATCTQSQEWVIDSPLIDATAYPHVPTKAQR